LLALRIRGGLLCVEKSDVLDIVLDVNGVTVGEVSGLYAASILPLDLDLRWYGCLAEMIGPAVWVEGGVIGVLSPDE